MSALVLDNGLMPGLASQSQGDVSQGPAAR